MCSKIIIRKAEPNDFNEIIEIWKSENIRVHNFIPIEYWEENYIVVKNALPQAEIYVSVYNGKIIAFIGLTDNYIEGIFVKGKYQHKEIGRELLNKIKEIKDSLMLKVYKKNGNAVAFYLKNNFVIIDTAIDASTKETEYSMQWRKKF